MNREAPLAIAALLVLAGCIAAPEDVETASTDAHSPLLQSLRAPHSPGGSVAGETIVLRTNATPDGALASFWWTIPPGVLVEDEDGESLLALHVAPVLLEEQRAPLERWVLMAFLAEEGKLALHQMAFGAPIHVSYGGFMGEGEEEVERSLDPFFWHIHGKLREGGRIGFVVGGVASEDVELALMLQPLAELPAKDEEPAEDTEDYLLQSDGLPRVALVPEATGGMHQVALYFEGGELFGSVSAKVGPVEVEGGPSGVGPVATMRRQTVSTGFDAGGWAISAAGYGGSGGVGSWEAVADAHGVSVQDGGTMASVLGLGASGMPFVAAIGEGDAAARTLLSLDLTSSSFSEGLFVFEFDLDRTLTALFGLPALDVTASGKGDLGRSGDDLVVDLPQGVRVSVPGIL